MGHGPGFRRHMDGTPLLFRLSAASTTSWNGSRGLTSPRSTGLRARPPNHSRVFVLKFCYRNPRAKRLFCFVLFTELVIQPAELKIRRDVVRIIFITVSNSRTASSC